MRRGGFVLAGGESSRMGADKALLPFNGTSLIEHVAAAVAAAAGTATIVGRPERYQGLGYPAIADLNPGCGPLGGIETALRNTSADWNLIVACDMPAITAGFLRELLDEAERSGGDCLVPMTPAGHLEPLCAAYHRDSLARIAAAIAGGDFAVRHAAAGPRTAYWRIADLSHFRNLNSPKDLENHIAPPAGAAGSRP